MCFETFRKLFANRDKVECSYILKKNTQTIRSTLEPEENGWGSKLKANPLLVTLSGTPA